MIKLRNIGIIASVGAGLLLVPALAMELSSHPVARFGRLGFDIDPAILLCDATDGISIALHEGDALQAEPTSPPVVQFGRLGFDIGPARPLCEATGGAAVALGDVDAQQAQPIGFDTGAPIAFSSHVSILIAELVPEATGGPALSSLDEQKARTVPGADLPVLPAFAMEPLGNGELNALRGGYVSAGGFQFDFGVKLETFIDGTLALTSTLNLSDQGLKETRTVSLPGAVPLAEAVARVPDLENIRGDGFVLQGNGGTTVLVQDLSLHSIRNLVVNTADDKHIVQNTEVTLVIPNLRDLMQAASFNDLMSNLHQALDSGLLDSVRR